MKRIPVVDLFAGPGGLGEGFSAFRDKRRRQRFEVVLSIESDPTAHETLLLRSFYRQFKYRQVPPEYFQYLRAEIKREKLFEAYPEQAERARKHAWLAELGKESEVEVDRRITTALAGRQDWLLLGGPPCQAYSIVGRVRMMGGDPEKFKTDHRHFLYKEYLRIIEVHKPPAFVMENVKGILSAEVKGDSVTSLILADFKRLGYSLHSFVSDQISLDLFGMHADPYRFIIQSEEYGLPQSRHRVIILGVREGVNGEVRQLRKATSTPSIWEAIKDLPKIRSRLSVKADSAENWAAEVRAVLENRALLKSIQDRGVRAKMKACARKIKGGMSTGGEYVASKSKPKIIRRWYFDPRLKGICNHSARAHISSDLHRYLFAACFAKIKGRSPDLKDFPKGLLPNHKNVEKGVEEGYFDDRFRVQVKGRPSTTITAHIAKDGHYFIHPDPMQCRSLTVREAARVQTFPDNYFFAGPRTEQYRQVGNAVPPFLARQLGEVVHGLFSAAKWSKVGNNGWPRPGKKKLEHVPDQIAGHRT